MFEKEILTNGCYKAISHRLVYVAATLGVIHFFLRVKKDMSEPKVYAAVLAILLLARVYVSARERRRRPR